MPERRAQIERWLRAELGLAGVELAPASSDASFRRYFRVVRPGAESLIVMDAPPARENCARYVQVAEAFARRGVHVPEVLAADYEQGFLLLSDLGTHLYLDVLHESNVERLYGDALGALLALQACGPTEESLLPPYDAVLLQREMALFPEWYLQRHCRCHLDQQQRAVLEHSFACLVSNALEQPRVCVHRDFHSRNLMVTDHNNPGILDFQDAVRGPVTYDLVSLLRDCYIEWPRARVEDWALGYQRLAVQSGVLREENDSRFLRWFDLMGVQRHLKAVGIFCRLQYRDNKSGYLRDIPRTLGYIVEVSGRYEELVPLHDLLGTLPLR